jgi:hypothetical protein
MGCVGVEMQKLLWLPFVFLSLLIPKAAHAEISIWCGFREGDLRCYSGVDSTFPLADAKAQDACNRYAAAGCEQQSIPAIDTCVAVARPASTILKRLVASHNNLKDVQSWAVDQCSRTYGESCILTFSACDPTAKTAVAPDQSFDFINDTQFWTSLILHRIVENISNGVGLGIGILLVTLIFAKRGGIANVIIHGNLPYTIQHRSEDIEVLFKRSQRINWQGRVIFGLTAQLGMTEQQLSLVRRYWLGRVIVFDSLRRQTQNELARLHLQQAAAVESKPKDQSTLAKFTAFFLAIFLILFFFIRAFFSFALAYLFIRVTLAKLVRGTLIESSDLTLLMEAKDVIEESSLYLKEYLLLAETFDGREEVYEPSA